MKKLIILGFLSMVIIQNVWAFGEESLRGIKTVQVFVEGLNENDKQDGLSENRLRTDVEIRLRQNGIKVVKDTAESYLYLDVLVLKHDIGIYVYNIKLELWQEVSLTRKPDIKIIGTTWIRGSLGYAGSEVFVDTVRKSVADKVDEFINPSS